MGKIGPRTNSRAVTELYCVTLAPYVQVFKYFLCFCISHTLRGTLVDVIIVCFFCSGTKLGGLCSLPVC